MATFRSKYSVSAWEIGKSLSWAEAVDLVDEALDDTGTELFASVAKWRFPASMPTLLMLAATVGNDAVMPWHGVPDRVDPADEAAAHAELLEEIRFST